MPVRCRHLARRGMRNLPLGPRNPPPGTARAIPGASVVRPPAPPLVRPMPTVRLTGLRSASCPPVIGPGDSRPVPAPARGREREPGPGRRHRRAGGCAARAGPASASAPLTRPKRSNTRISAVMIAASTARTARSKVDNGGNPRTLPSRPRSVTHYSARTEPGRQAAGEAQLTVSGSAATQPEERSWAQRPALCGRSSLGSRGRGPTVPGVWVDGCKAASAPSGARRAASQSRRTTRPAHTHHCARALHARPDTIGPGRRRRVAALRPAATDGSSRRSSS